MPGPGAYWFGEEEIEAVMEVMKGGYLFRYGSENDPKFLHKVSSLEKEFAKYTGVEFALATSSTLNRKSGLKMRFPSESTSHSMISMTRRLPSSNLFTNTTMGKASVTRL